MMKSARDAGYGSCPGNVIARIQGGSFSESDSSGGVRLIGSECGECGQRMFPARVRCVTCFGANIRECQFAAPGTVVSFTIVRQAPPGYFGSIPYALGMVQLAENIQVLTHLVGRAVEDWQPGDRVESCAMSLATSADESSAAQTFAFRPIDRS